MAERTVSWKPRGENHLLGTEVDRLDGIAKATGTAKYSADINTPGTIVARLLTSPHAHATIKSLDVSAAKKVPGVRGVYVFPRREAGYEIKYEGEPLVAVAGDNDGAISDGLEAIRVEYEPLDHLVDGFDIAAATEQGRARELRESEEGNLGEALANADAVVTGRYGIHAITHMCLEPHGSHCEWQGNDRLNVHLSTQNVSGTAAQFAGAPEIGIDAANVTVNCEYIGGGFGSKFAADEWGVACAVLARETKRPVRLMLDRQTELKAGGNRPSGFAQVTIAADEEGKITAWESHHWGTDGPGGGTVSPTVMPYVVQPANRRVRATGISTNCGPVRAWRAPNHPQACALTDTAIDDLAAELEMDPYDLFMKNLDLTWNPDLYRDEMEVAAKLMDWSGKWTPRGEGGDGPVKRGLGMALHTWGGRAGRGTCTVKVHPDGAVETFAGTQDLGTGTRTVIGITVAETFGIPLSSVNVNIGKSSYPVSGPSGGSTTVGGVSGPHRRAALEALWKIFDLVAAKYEVDAASLKAVDGKIVSGDKVVCTWPEATRLIGAMPLEVQGKGPENDGLTSERVGGVQMVDASVDTETGVVRINKYVAVQDMGTIINRKAARSQILGAMIMCIAYALSEERIMDERTGRFINADLKNYKLPRIGDIGELVVELYEPDSQYERGVVGLGEPPVISGGAAISNAVANAIGKRVPVLPLTPKRVLDTLRS
ncbi:Xanthine dehydrogenase molybdenum-binding subunit [Maioricimonas rarisocia]|uniref:Xanthine dehydrogenase molybdenum-binding subunit n=2 Tax=Maioricimonas rarisocia TaxID=2528026 RepID=A0A517Z5X9_9PLAN|nr:Xanthine dehydrogenase molybdenum-binding subunit [Maioricimonas rarisocia]